MNNLPVTSYVGHARVLRSVNKFADAEAMLQHAITLDAKDPLAVVCLGDLYLESERFAQAIEQYERAIPLAPKSIEILCNYGVALQAATRLTDAEKAYRKALHLHPDSIPILINLAGISSVLGHHDKAIRLYRRVLKIAPDDPMASVAHSNLIFTLDLVDGAEAEKQAERKLWEKLHVGFPQNRIWKFNAGDLGVDKDPQRPLRVGYVSADFRNHSAASLFGPVIRHHDRKHYLPYLYHSGRIGDDLTIDFYAQAEEWTECHAMPDDTLAAKIRADKIDILVDLSGHSKGNRLKTFALRPAPIQVTGWGHPTGTGLSTIDYLMTDPFVIPEERRSLFAEKCWDLPYFLPFEPTDTIKIHPILPRPQCPFTFGSLNRLSKLSDRTLKTWAKILRRSKQSRLFLKDYALDTGSERDKIWGFFKAEGIDPARIELRGGSTKADHLAAYNNVDLALDPFPQSGGTSSFEAIYMGVPVLAMAGASVSARGSASIMLGLDFSGLVAESEPVYIDMAVKAAKWPPKPRGEELRALLMSRHGDGKAYCRAVETAYRAMWKEWCDGKADRA